MDRANEPGDLPGRSGPDLEDLMERYQRADAMATSALIGALSPALLRYFRAEPGSREHALDLLQDTWLRIHRVRHTYRRGEPLLPWVYAIARRVKVDGYRKRRRVERHEIAADPFADPPGPAKPESPLPEFDALVAGLPPAQREVVTMLKVGGLSLEEVARATSTSVGAVKQKAHRAYEKLRALLDPARAEGTQ